MSSPPEAHGKRALEPSQSLPSESFDASAPRSAKRPRPSMERDGSDPYHTILRQLSGMNDFAAQHTMGREKLDALLAGLTENADDSHQLTCLSELCNFLSISTEDTASGFRPDAFAPLLVQCMRRDHNIDIMLLAARALTHLMDALPQSCSTVVAAGAVPVFCEKLLAIEFIDLAEQCLGALEKLSQDHAHVLLKEGALNAMLSFIDFFGINVQRKVVHTAANLCKRVPKTCLPMIQDILPTLINFLTYDDSKVVENAVLCFSRLVSSFADDEKNLQIILTDRLVANLIDLLGVRRNGGAPADNRADIGPSTATTILRTLGAAARSSLPLTRVMLDAGLVPLLAALLAASTAPTGDPDSNANGSPRLGPQMATSPSGLASPPSVQGSPTQASLSHKMGKASTSSAEIIHETVTLFNDLLPHIQSGVLSELHLSRRSSQRLPSSRDFALDIGDAEEPTGSARVISLHHHPVAPSKLESAWVCDAPGDCLRGLKRGVATGGHLGVSRWRCVSGCDWDICDRCLAHHCGKGAEEEEGEEEEEVLAEADHRKSKKSKDRKEREKEWLKRQLKDNKKGKREKDKEREKEREREPEARAEPGEPPKPSEREEMYRAHPEHLQMIAENVHSVLQVYAATMHSAIRAKCLAILSKVVHFLPNDALRELLRTLPISGFLATLLHSGDLHATASALHIAHVLMDKLPDVFQVLFVREGVLNEISLLATKPEGAQPSPPRSASAAALHAHLAATAKAFLVRHFGARLEAASEEQEEALCSEVARHLHQLAHLLEHYEERSVEQQLADLSALGAVLASEESVSTYEVLTSGIIPALLHYLSHKPAGAVGFSRHERAGRLLCTLGRPCREGAPPADPGRGGTYLQLLVGKLQAALSQEENLPIHVNDYAENNMTSSTLNCLKMLMQPFRLTLVHDRKEPPGEGRSTTVMVEPLATVGAVEDFIQTKLLSPSSPSAQASATMKPEDEEMDGEEEDFPEEQETKEILPPRRVTRSQTRLERERLEREKQQGAAEPKTPADPEPGTSPVSSGADKGKEPRRNQDSEPTSDSKKEGEKDKRKGKERKDSAAPPPLAPPRVIVRAASTTLQPSLTIFQVVHKHGDWRSPQERQSPEGPAHLTSRRMWDVCHVLHYSVADDTAGAASTESGAGPERDGRDLVAEAHAASVDGGRLTGLVTEGIVAIEHALEDTLAPILGDLGHSLTPTTRHLLLLLRALHAINGSHDALTTFLTAVGDAPPTPAYSYGALSDSEFVSSKLTNKLLCQVHDPLLLCSGYLSSSWCQALAVECAFLFSFPTRRTFFELSSFGATRAMLTLQERFSEQGEQLRLGRVQKQKIRLSRAHILESAMKVMTLYGSQKAFLEFEFFGEVGTGLGPTLEFYTLVSKAIQAAKLGMWRNEAEPAPAPAPALLPLTLELSDATDGTEGDEKILEDDEEYVLAPHGLFPAPLSPTDATAADVVRLFTFLGEFMGRAMVDKRIIDIPLSIPFLKMLRGHPLCIDDIKHVRPELHAFLLKALALVRQKQRLEASLADPDTLQAELSSLHIDGASVEDLCLDFTLPGHEDISLKPNGKDIPVTIENLEEYVALVVEVMLRTSVEPQMAAFRKGFGTIFPIRQMRLFSVQEMDEMFCGSAQPITREQLEAHTVCDHGYTSNSRAIHFLFNIITAMEPPSLRQFILFLTGAPRLPVGGLKNLKPPLTVVRKTPDPSFDAPMKVADALPSVMTCANYLKLPDYASEEVMRDKLYTAMTEGQQSFHLS